MHSQLLFKNTSFIKRFNNSLNILSNDIKEKYKSQFNLRKNIIEHQMNILELYIYMSNYKYSKFIEIISSICFKNLITITSSLELIQSGYLGSAKILYRNAYESLIIGKYLGVTNDETLLNNFLKGKQISLKKDIFNNLENSPSKDSIEFWDFLNKYTHYTSISQQIDLNIDEKEIDNCLCIIDTLLAMNNHLLNNYTSKFYNYYFNLYSQEYFKQQKEMIKNYSKICLNNLDKRCINVINSYKTTWKLKNKNH